LVFVGIYRPILFGTGKILQGKGEGIYVYRLDASSGSMELCSIAQACPNPSYLTFDPSRRFLYVVNELKEFDGAPSGAVSAFSVDSTSGALRFLNRQPSHGTDPCHLTVDKTGRYALVANL
jgi:6-phosphogluconolactonase